MKAWMKHVLLCLILIAPFAFLTITGAKVDPWIGVPIVLLMITGSCFLVFLGIASVLEAYDDGFFDWFFRDGWK